MELEVPKKAYFQSYINLCHSPKGFDVGEANEVLSLRMSRDHGRENSILLFLPLLLLLAIANVSIVTRKEGKKGRRSNMKKIPETDLFDIY